MSTTLLAAAHTARPRANQGRCQGCHQESRLVRGEPGAQAEAAAPPGHQRASERQADQRPALDAENGDRQSAGGQVQPFGHRRNASGPARRDQPRDAERRPCPPTCPCHGTRVPVLLFVLHVVCHPLQGYVHA